MDLIIETALESRPNKLSLILLARVKVEKLKRFFRMMHDLDIVETKKYLEFEIALQEISKGTNNWISFLKNPPASKTQLPTENLAID